MGEAQPIPPWRRGPAFLHRPRVARNLRHYGCFDILGTDTLVEALRSGSARKRAAASEALRLVGSEVVLRALIAAARAGNAPRAWVLATLGRLDAVTVRSALAADPLLAEVEPLLALGPSDNWLASLEVAADLRFLLLQDVAT